VIVGFYLVFPLMARPYYRHPLIGLAVAAAITVAWREGADHTGLLAGIEGSGASDGVVGLMATDQLPGWAFSFALGMTAAWAYVRLERAPPKTDVGAWATGAAAAGLIACVVCGWVFADYATGVGGAGGLAARSHSWLMLAYAAAQAVLMSGIALGPRWLQRPFANRLTGRLAELSYPVYLVHVPFAIYIGLVLLELPQGSWADFALWCAAVLPVCVLYAAFSLRFVERPARLWARRRSRAQPSAQKPATAAAT
jgi:peptidoglycan/LPS O-acetylase OafA/YrhL